MRQCNSNRTRYVKHEPISHLPKLLDTVFVIKQADANRRGLDESWRVGILGPSLGDVGESDGAVVGDQSTTSKDAIDINVILFETEAALAASTQELEVLRRVRAAHASNQLQSESSQVSTHKHNKPASQRGSTNPGCELGIVHHDVGLVQVHSSVHVLVNQKLTMLTMMMMTWWPFQAFKPYIDRPIDESNK